MFWCMLMINTNAFWGITQMTNFPAFCYSLQCLKDCFLIPSAYISTPEKQSLRNSSFIIIDTCLDHTQKIKTDSLRSFHPLLTLSNHNVHMDMYQ